MSVQTGCVRSDHAPKANWSAVREERKAAVKRSRTGCLTCRKCVDLSDLACHASMRLRYRRKKKCPEEWQDGACLRCLQGGWHCLPPGPPSHSSNRSRKSAQPVSRVESTPTVLGRSHPSGGYGLGSLAFITNPSPIEQHNGYQSHSDDSHSGDQSMDDSESPEFSHAALFPEAQEDHVLDEFYESHLLPSWASTYPQTVAENMMIRLSKTTLHHPVARLARHAASAAYLTAYRAERDAPSLKGCRMSGKSALTDTMKQFPTDPHHLLQKAIHDIEQPLTESELTPELTLWILAHLHWAGVAIADTPTRQRIMSVADRLVLNTFGERSMLDLASLQGYSTICLKWYAVADISRSLAQGRKTTLDYIYTNRKIKGFSWDPLQDAENEADGSHDLYFGLSSNLLALVFDSSTLIAQALQLSSLLRLPPTMLEQANRLILNLYDWRPDVSIYQENTNRLSLSYGPEISCNQELWRLVTILMLKIYVCRCSVAEEVIQELIKDGVDLVSAMIPLAATRRANSRSVVDLWTAFNAQPTFLLGGFLQNAADRRMVKRFIDDSGPEMALNDMKALLQATWAESDRTGSFVDWHWIKDTRNMGLTFM